MKYLKYILLLVLILTIGFSIYISTLDSEYDVSANKTIKAPKELIFNTINDYKTWQHWGPWYEIDPTIVASYPDVTSGIGASYSWIGKEGNGSMKTLSLVPNKEIIQQIDFGTGSTPEIYWDINYTENGNKVTWGMRGKSTFTEKAYWLTQGGIEKNMTPMYNRGLELLETYLLKEMDKHSFKIIGEVEHGGGFYLYQKTTCKTTEADILMGKMFTEVQEYMTLNSIDSAGKPFLLTHNWDETNNSTTFSTCIPVSEKINTSSSILTGLLEPQKTFKTIYKGSYQYSYKAWEAAYKALSEQGFTQLENGEPYEVYKIRPIDNPNPASWITEIYIPIE
ncbi:SRPBCC family protein [Lutibacter citreus]|uniref:SRPBCC family protein n=1 Tax=Lutibacter citreus TaxID=2138210 RepID=UPI000DBE5CCE|nr:GyrI-like domain-containing protein [Lutibacter citreus]